MATALSGLGSLYTLRDTLVLDKTAYENHDLIVTSGVTSNASVNASGILYYITYTKGDETNMTYGIQVSTDGTTFYDVDGYGATLTASATFRIYLEPLLQNGYTTVRIRCRTADGTPTGTVKILAQLAGLSKLTTSA